MALPWVVQQMNTAVESQWGSQLNCILLYLGFVYVYILDIIVVRVLLFCISNYIGPAPECYCTIGIP